jgi:hypothetical protein
MSHVTAARPCAGSWSAASCVPMARLQVDSDCELVIRIPRSNLRTRSAALESGLL